ncbi:hypothetical protein F4803DRAFT_555159 [Xylaria telfairii]|nr:hypothetical protein F4803DRAFT_555159 [Xylaria telfairii]
MSLNNNRILIDNPYVGDWFRHIPESNIIPDDVEFEVRCPICREIMCGPDRPPHKFVVLPCGHVLGEDCLDEWYNALTYADPGPTCPICRGPLFICEHTGRQLIPFSFDGSPEQFSMVRAIYEQHSGCFVCNVRTSFPLIDAVLERIDNAVGLNDNMEGLLQEFEDIATMCTGDPDENRARFLRFAALMNHREERTISSVLLALAVGRGPPPQGFRRSIPFFESNRTRPSLRHAAQITLYGGVVSGDLYDQFQNILDGFMRQWLQENYPDGFPW